MCGQINAQATDVYYLRGNINEPWCCGWAPYPNANPTELDAVFGAGGWTLNYYETAVAASIFSDNTCYVYMEGGDGHTNLMETFFIANQTTIEQWVYDGGSLFMNAAPNIGNGMSYGFGGVWLWYPYWWSSYVTVHPGATAHPIWTGPFTPTVTNMTGTSYTHAYVSGGSVTPIIVDTYSPSYYALTEKTWGTGHVFHGGMTTASWHYPAIEASNVKKNMHSYLAGLCNLILLSVDFTDFSARVENGDVLLKWVTANEMNNDYFTVERSSNGLIWSNIGVIDGAGTSLESRNYQMYDEHPLIGTSYYRIKQTDFNGQSSNTRVEEINIEETLTLYPVPASDHIQLQFKEMNGAVVTVLNSIGEKLQCEQTISYNTVKIDLSEIPSGVYFIQTQNEGEPISRKFIKR